MYLHLGNSVLVKTEDIVAVFDLDNSSHSHITREYLKKAQEAGRVSSSGEELPKSVVLCGAGNEETVHLSQLASSTLLKRAESALFDMAAE